MATDLKALASSIVGLTLKEAKELSDILENEHGIKPAAAAVIQQGGPAAAEEVEKTEFDLVMTSAGANKIPVIKVVRELTNLGLKEAKALVDAAPKAILEKKPKAEVEEGKKKLEEAGATCEVK